MNSSLFNFGSFYAPLSCFFSFTTLLMVALHSTITEQLDILKLHYFLLWCHCHIAIKDTTLLLNAISWTDLQKCSVRSTWNQIHVFFHRLYWYTAKHNLPNLCEMLGQDWENVSI